MCDECRSKASDHILDAVIKGYPLDAAIHIVRDMVVQRGLMDRGALAVETIEDIQALSDDVTAAGEVLTDFQQNVPGIYAVIVENRRYDREYGVEP